MRSTPPSSQGGFTLVELIMALSLALGLSFVIVRAGSLVGATSAQRSALEAQSKARSVASAITSDLSTAYLDSVRFAPWGTSGFVMEFAPAHAWGRYRAGAAASTSTTVCSADDSRLDPLVSLANDQLSLGVPDSCFKTIGPVDATSVSVGDWVSLPGAGSSAFYANGAATGGSKALLGPMEASPTETRIEIDPHNFGTPSSDLGFAIVGQPMAWVCDPEKKTLSKFQGYTWSTQTTSVFDTPPKLVIEAVASCSVSLQGPLMQGALSIENKGGQASAGFSVALRSAP